MSPFPKFEVTVKQSRTNFDLNCVEIGTTKTARLYKYIIIFVRKS